MSNNKRQYVTVRLPDDIMAKLKAEAERKEEAFLEDAANEGVEVS